MKQPKEPNHCSVDIKNTQSEARVVRYNLLTDFCKRKKIKTILTAHNLEDQVETFFIRLSRGSGLYGLSSMKQISEISKKIHLVRPLLDVKKEKLIKISKTVFGKYFKDPTNVNSKYLRTRIRSLKKSLEKSGINYDQIFQSIKNLATKILTVLNSDLEPIFVPERPKEVKLAHCSAEKARNLLGYETTTSLDDSIKKIAEWIISKGSKKI